YYGGFRIHPFAELDIEGYYSHVDQKLGILSGSIFGNLEDIERAITIDTPFFTMPFSYDIGKPRQETQHDLYKATIRYVGQNHSFKAVYGQQLNKRQEFGVRRVDAPNIDLELKTQSLDVDWIHEDLFGLSGRFGVQLLKKANDNQPGTNTVPFIPNYDEDRVGIYLIESLDLGKSSIELGVRYDYMESQITGREPDNSIYRNTIIYKNFSGTLGLKTKLGEYATFQSNIGTAWRAPNVAELYRFGQHTFFLEYGLWRYTIDDRFDFITTSQGILTQEDRPVPSEVGYKWINTYSINKPNFQAEITGYINYIENYIFAKPGGVTRNPRGFFVFNIYDQTDALFWGVDFKTEWKHSTTFSSTLQGSYLWSKQTDVNDFFVGQPPAQIGYALNYKPKISFLDHTDIGIAFDYTFEQFQHPRILTVEEFLNSFQTDLVRFEDDAPDFDILPPPPGFLLTDFSWKSSIKKLDVQFQVRNVFNTSYRVYTDRIRYFADDLGRNLILSLTYRI
ncbi:MAG: TonB-dependent receptor, partial [Bacteroidota bacterium]